MLPLFKTGKEASRLLIGAGAGAFARQRQRSAVPALFLARSLATPRAGDREGRRIGRPGGYGGRRPGLVEPSRGDGMQRGPRKGDVNFVERPRPPRDLSRSPLAGQRYTAQNRPAGQDLPGRRRVRDAPPRDPSDRPLAPPGYQAKTARPPFSPGADPHLTAMKLTRYLERLPQPYTSADLEAAERIIKGAPKMALSVAVWNILLKAYGRAKMYSKMFKVYNDMKKTGIIPSSRTYTTLLSNFSKSLGSTSEGTMARATLIYDQAQRHLRNLTQGSITEGVSSTAAPDTPAKDNVAARALADEITVAPTNAYLQCLAHFGNMGEILRVVSAMPLEGRLAPDKYTYTVAFTALLADSGKDASGAAKQFWDRLVQQRKALVSAGKPDNVLDTAVATLAFRCFMQGDDELKRFGLSLLSPLFGLSSPGKSAALVGAGSEPDLAPLPLNDRAAETAVKLCLAADKPALAAHMAEQILQQTDVVARMSPQGANGLIEAFAAAGDVARCVDLLQHGIGRRNEAWNEESYCEAIKGVLRKGDWDVADKVYELALQQSEAIAQAPQLFGLLIRTAINSGRVAAMRQAWKHYMTATRGQLPSIDTSLEGQAARRAMFWRGKLRQDVDELTQRLLTARAGEKTGVKAKEEQEIRLVRDRMAQEGWGLEGVQNMQRDTRHGEQEAPRRSAAGRR